MMLMRKMFIPADVVAKGRPKFARTAKGVRAFTPKKTMDAEETLAWLTEGFFRDPIADVPIFLEIVCFVERPPSVKASKRPLPIAKPDLDNYVKLLMDAMNKRMWVDDSIVCGMTAWKVYTNGRTGYGLKIFEIDELPMMTQEDYEFDLVAQCE